MTALAPPLLNNSYICSWNRWRRSELYAAGGYSIPVRASKIKFRIQKIISVLSTPLHMRVYSRILGACAVCDIAGLVAMMVSVTKYGDTLTQNGLFF